ncbi:unnamed protein product, partial [marine sediment metagenome]
MKSLDLIVQCSDEINSQIDPVPIEQVYPHYLSIVFGSSLQLFDNIFSHHLVLKTKPRISNLAKAQKLLKEVIEEDAGQKTAIINLCDILLVDLRNTNDMEIVDEIKDYIGRLLNIAEKTHSYSLQAEAYLLQAKMVLISSDLEEARRLLAKGQQIAEKFGLNRLAMSISEEHDKLLNELSVWEGLRESNASMGERIELAR